MRIRQILPLFVLLLLVSGTLASAECQDTKIFLQQVTDSYTKDVTIYAYVNANISGGAVYGSPDAILDFVSPDKSDPLCAAVLPEKKTVDTGDYYEHVCKLKYADIKGTCNQVSAVLKGPAKYCQAESSTTVCDYSSTSFSFITTTFNESLAKVSKENYGMCLISFIMLGVLLSTMFYSGKSPMSLLNITTPNLPSPKTLAAGGQVLGHMVYGRMKEMYVLNLAKLGKVMDIHTADLEKAIRARNQEALIGKINSMFANIRGDPHSRSVLKFLALSMAADGKTIEDIRKIVKGKSLFAYSKEENIEVGKAVQSLKKKNNKAGVAAASMVDNYILTYIALNKMKVLTGESGENRGVMDVLYWLARTPVDGIQVLQNAPYIGGKKWVKKVLESPPAKVISFLKLKDFPIIGKFVGTSIDSLFRSIRMTGRYGQVVGGSIARGVARKSGMVNAEKLRAMGEALDKERVGEQKMSYLQRMGYATLTAGSPETTKAGGMYPILRKITALYDTVYKEGHYDAMYYILKRIYAEHGVKLDELTEKQVAKFMYKDVDIIELVGLKNNPRSRELHEIEEKIRGILKAKPGVPNPNDPEGEFNAEVNSLNSKVDALKILARGSGVYVDPQMENYLNAFHSIHESGEETHIKFLNLRKYLVEMHHVDDPKYVPQDKVSPNDFYTLVGRDNLGRDRFSQHAIRNIIFSAENDSLNGGGLEDALKQMWVYLINRTRSLSPINDPEATKEMKEETTKITKRIEQYMLELMTEDGRKAFETYRKNPTDWGSVLTGKEHMKNELGAKGREIYVEFGDAGRAGFLRTTLEKMVSNGVLPSNTLEKVDDNAFMKGIRWAFPAFFKKGADIAYHKKNGMPVYWLDDGVLGPSKSWWKMDMKRDWQTSGSSEQTIEYYVNGIFGKGYKMPYKASVFRELMGENGWLHDPEGKVKDCNPNSITKEFAQKVLKPAFAKDALFNEMDNFLNGVMAMNAYKNFNETSRFYIKTMQGMLLGAVSNKLRNEMEEEKNPSAAKRLAGELESATSEIEALNPVANRTDLNKLISLLKQNKDTLKSFVEKPFTYDLLEKSSHAWVMLHEGGFAPFIQGMPLSDFDRAMGGFVALKDTNGKWRRFDPQNVDITFGTDAESLELRKEFGALQSQRDSQGFGQIQDAHGNIRQVNWDGFLNKAGDWAKGNYERQKQYNAVLWRYAQNTEDWHGFWNKSDITIRPKHEVLGVRSSFLPYPSASDMSSDKMEPLRKIREWGRGVGLWMERSSLYSAGNVYSSSYSLVSSSKYLALQLVDYARDIRLHKDNIKELGVNENTYKALDDLADHVTSKLLMTQDFGIDRHPGRHSTSHGLQSALAASFHYGPAATWDTRWYKAYFTKTEYAPYALATWPAQIARYLALPAITAFRGFQMSLFGYPNKWNYQESAMQPFAYRYPDLLGAFRSIFNPFHSSLDWFGGGGEMVQRDMGGPKFRRGLKQIPEEMNWIGKGTQYWARVGAANPGETRLNPRMVLEIASPMAEFMAHRDQFAGYYSQDPNIQKQAYNTYIKREVSGPALMIRREEELRGYSPMANPIWGWTSPAMFLWHLPGSPFSPRDFYMHYKEGKRRMGWEEMSTFEKTRQVVFGGGGSMKDGVLAQLKPWYTGESGETKLYGMGGRMKQGTTRSIIACPTCQGLMQRWGACPRCSRRSRR